MSKKLIESDNTSKFRYLKAVDIIPKDDTFHGNKRFLDIEWWYFDAVFDDGYSIHIGFRTYHIKKIGIVQSRITIYKKGKLDVETKKTDFFSKFHVLSDNPTIQINNETVVKFDSDHYKKTGEWKYQIKLRIKNNEADLVFIGTTKGWKMETTDTCWAVPLPKANVKGTITIEGQKKQVNGIGYHDHNWSYSPMTAMNNLGWYWGRITGEKTDITWAKTIQNMQKSNLITVLNIDESQGEKQLFFNVKPENIKLLQNKYENKKRRQIPTEFKLKINDDETNKIPIKIDIDMTTVDIQYQRIFTIQYYRYHVKATGEIKIGGTTENLRDNPQIIEFLSFKSKKFT